jgi:hypothetical protein
MHIIFTLFISCCTFKGKGRYIIVVCDVHVGSVVIGQRREVFEMCSYCRVDKWRSFSRYSSLAD